MFSQALVDTYSRMVDPRLGIVRRIAEVPLQPGEPPLFVLAANCTRPKYFLRNTPCAARHADYIVPANGVALTKEQAMWRVLGEACERYAAGIYADENFVTASQQELGPTALPVEKLIGFSDVQYARADFPFVRFNPEAAIRWAHGTNLTQQKAALIPAALVYFGYAVISPQEVFYPCMSTGMAAGRTLTQALLAGLCELVERDAFMATWLLQRPPERVPLAVLESVLSPAEMALIHNDNVDVCLAFSTTDISIPSAITVIRPHGRAAAVVGSAAHPHVSTALSRSLLEAYHTLNWSITLERNPRAVDVASVHEFEDHVRLYLQESHFPSIAWLAQGRDHIYRPDASVPEEGDEALLARAQQCVERAGYEVYFVETTTADIRQLGFRAVRVIVPGLHPLNMGAGTVHEDTRRLQRVAAHWGIGWPRQLNANPHPFP